jgi:hypothetical protein
MLLATGGSCLRRRVFIAHTDPDMRRADWYRQFAGAAMIQTHPQSPDGGSGASSLIGQSFGLVAEVAKR